MKKTVGNFLICGLMALSLATCVEPLRDIPEEVNGLAPVYESVAWDLIEARPPQAIESLGKIYYKDGLIFATEAGRGIHIIDNKDPKNPRKLAFIRIPGNSDLAIRGNLLYANNMQDLVTIDISDLDRIAVVHRLPGAFPLFDQASLSPPGYAGFFECVDPDQGVVTGWTEKVLRHPECWK